MEAEAREQKARIEAASAAAEELERKAREEARPRSSETQAKYLVIAVSLAESQRDGNSLVISGNPSILQNFLGVKLRKTCLVGHFGKSAVPLARGQEIVHKDPMYAKSTLNTPQVLNTTAQRIWWFAGC